MVLLVRILPWTRLFCNVHLFCVPRSWTGSVQMKPSMTFIRGNRCIGREKDNFKSREVKRLKKCTLALKCLGESYELRITHLISKHRQQENVECCRSGKGSKSCWS